MDIGHPIDLDEEIVNDVMWNPIVFFVFNIKVPFNKIIAKINLAIILLKVLTKSDDDYDTVIVCSRFLCRQK